MSYPAAERLCRNSKKRPKSACHAGLDPASRNAMHWNSTGFRVKPGMTKQQAMMFYQLRHSLRAAGYQMSCRTWSGIQFRFLDSDFYPPFRRISRNDDSPKAAGSKQAPLKWFFYLSQSSQGSQSLFDLNSWEGNSDQFAITFARDSI